MPRKGAEYLLSQVHSVDDEGANRLQSAQMAEHIGQSFKAERRQIFPTHEPVHDDRNPRAGVSKPGKGEMHTGKTRPTYELQ